MLNNIYVYRYLKYTDIVKKIDKYKFIKKYEYEDIESYYIYNPKSKDTIYLYDKFNIHIFRKEKIVVFITEKYQYIKNFCMDDNLIKYNLLSIECFKSLVSKEFNRSLTNINIQFDYIDDEGEDFELIGSEIDALEIIYDMGFKNNYDNIKIKSYSMQPLKCNYIMHIKSTNKIEIKKKCSEYDLIEMIIRLVTTISIGGNNKYGEYLDK